MNNTIDLNNKPIKATNLQRGKRIKLARQLANLTRKDMMVKYGINNNTLQAWERGINLLTDQQASKLVESFRSSGLNLTKDWLLYGTSFDNNIIETQNTNDSPIFNISNIKYEISIISEINYFRNSNPNAITTLVTDDALSPFFNKGDYVGGIRVTGEEITKLVGKTCIINTDKEELLLRKIFSCTNNKFVIGCINPATEISELNIKCNIDSAAKITRHWIIDPD